MRRRDLHYWRADGNRRVRRRRRRGLATRLALALLCGGGLGGGLLYGGRTLGRELLLRPSCQVRQIEIEGARFLDPRRLRGRLDGFVGASLLLVDLDAVREAAESEPWVSRASVARLWPSVLRVTVTERRPAAVAILAGGAWLIADDGTPLEPHGGGAPVLDLPVLTGVVDAAAGAPAFRRGVAVIEALRAEAPALAEQVSSVDLSDAGRTEVHLSGVPFPLWLDPERPGRNLRSYEALRRVMNREVIPARVDLRFEGRIAVLPRPVEGEPPRPAES